MTRARAAQSKNVEGETAIFYPVKNKNPDMVRMLCEFGANVNVASYMKDTPLKAACRANNIEIVNALLDWRATRRPSAFDLLKGYAKGEIDRRLEIERKEKQAEAEAAIKAKQGKKGQKFQQGSKSEYGEWRPYLDKRKRGIFYYNRVSRVSQFEVRASVCHARVLLAVEVRACPFQLPEDCAKDKTYMRRTPCRMALSLGRDAWPAAAPAGTRERPAPPPPPPPLSGRPLHEALFSCAPMSSP